MQDKYTLCSRRFQLISVQSHSIVPDFDALLAEITLKRPTSSSWSSLALNATTSTFSFELTSVCKFHILSSNLYMWAQKLNSFGSPNTSTTIREIVLLKPSVASFENLFCPSTLWYEVLSDFALVKSWSSPLRVVQSITTLPSEYSIAIKTLILISLQSLR